MNDMVLFLVIAAALIFIGLFVWSRMEAKKSKDQNISLSQESKKMYDKMRSVIPTKKVEAPQVSLIQTEEPSTKQTEENIVEVPHAVNNATQQPPHPTQLTTESPTEIKESEADPFVVEDVTEHEESSREASTKKDSSPKEDNPIENVVPQFNNFVKTQTPVAELRELKVEEVPAKEIKKEPIPAAFDLVETPKIEKPIAKQPQELVVPIAKPSFPKEGMLNYEFDDLTESVGMIISQDSLPGSTMVDMAKNLRKLNLPIRIYVRSVENKRWYEPRVEGSYNEMAVVLLLATRQSCINEIDASRFAVAIQQAGIALDADSDTEPAQEIVRRAKRLYDSITSLDVQLSIVLSSREVIPSQELTDAARLAGFTQLNPTRYFLGSAKEIAQATIFLRVTDYDRHQLTLVLDAPLANPNSKPLHRLFSVANDLSCRLGLEMQDTRGQPINSEAAQAIHNQLSKYYQQMLKAEIQPGSSRARILFSRE